MKTYSFYLSLILRFSEIILSNLPLSQMWLKKLWLCEDNKYVYLRKVDVISNWKLSWPKYRFILYVHFMILAPSSLK